MWTGQQTLQSINQTLQVVNDDVETINTALTQLSSRLAHNKREQINTYQALAKLRLSELEGRSMNDVLSHVDAQAINALEQRQQSIEDINISLAEQHQQLSELQVKREQQFHRVEEHNKQLLDSEAVAQQALENDARYQAQLKQAQQADAIADSAEEKLGLANEDRQHKGKPFEKDTLFMYLWQRHYGQPEYRANPLIRTLDAWVAKLCRYNDARGNYWLLLELPKRLATHAKSVREQAEEELRMLESLEQTVAAAHQVPEYQQVLETEQQQLAAIDEEETRIEQYINQLMTQQLHYSTGDDQAYQEIIVALSEALQRQDMLELKRLSNRTIDRDDDHLVSLLVDLKEEGEGLQETITANKQRQMLHLQRLQELKQLRQKFKRRRFDDFRSGFDNESLIAIALSEFLKGMLNSSDLWRTIERSQRYRNTEAWPDFGSGGLGRKGRRRSTWHWPGNHNSNGGFRLPRSGGSLSRGRGSGGFKTGGGF